MASSCETKRESKERISCQQITPVKNSQTKNSKSWEGRRKIPLILSSCFFPLLFLYLLDIPSQKLFLIRFEMTSQTRRKRLIVTDYAKNWSPRVFIVPFGISKLETKYHDLWHCVFWQSSKLVTDLINLRHLSSYEETWRICARIKKIS